MLDGFDVKDPKANRVLRGGSWSNFANYARGANRSYVTPTSSDYRNGFRLARGRLQTGEAGSR